MKVAIASDDGKNISAQFEKTTGFIIFLIDKDKTIYQKDFIANSSVSSAKDNTLQAKNSALESRLTLLTSLDNCDVVISRGIGFNAYTDLLNSEIEVYLTKVLSADQAINLYLKDELDHNPELRKNR